MSSFATNAICAYNTLCTHELMEETVDVMNQALHRSKSKPLAKKISNGRRLRVHVVSSRDLSEKEAVIIRFDKERVELLQTDKDVTADGTIKVCEEHLEDVSNDPDTYVEDPLKLELVWVKERMTSQEA